MMDTRFQMQLLRSPVVVCCLMLLGVSLHAEERRLSLEDCIQLALQNNLGLESSRLSPELSRLFLEQSLTAWDPSLRFTTDATPQSEPGGVDAQNRPFIGTETTSERFSSGLFGKAPIGLQYSMNVDTSHREGSNAGGPFENTFASTRFELRQSMLRNLWIDNDRMQIRINRNNLRSSELGLKAAVMSLVAEVERAYYNLILARDRVAVREEGLALTERLLKANQRRVEVGLMAQLDEKQSESQVAAGQSTLRAAQKQLVDAELTLKRLLTSDIAEWFPIAIRPTAKLLALPRELDVQTSWGKALRSRPDLLQARIQIESNGVRLRFRKNQLFPQLDLVATAGYTGSKREYGPTWSDVIDGDSPRYSIGAVFSIPLGNRSARKSLEVQKLQNERSLILLKNQEQRIMTEVASGVEAARSAYDLVASTRKAREFAEIALDAEGKKLEIGKSTSFIVLQLQRDLTNARSAEINALADYNRALSSLALAEGATLDRLNINMEVSGDK